jgi:hypothetical protein
MSTTRDHTEFVFQCDNPDCGETYETGEHHFPEALEQAKLNGWVARNIAGTWKHFHTEQCYREEMRRR